MNTLLLRYFLAIAVMGSLSACFPYRFVDAPAVAGQVVSHASGRPVAGALVSLSAGHASTQVRTDARGSFRLPTLEHTGLYLVGMESWYPHGDLRIETAGFHSYLEHGVGSPNSRRGLVTEDGGVEYGRVGPELEHIHVALSPST